MYHMPDYEWPNYGEPSEIKSQHLNKTVIYIENISLWKQVMIQGQTINIWSFPLPATNIYNHVWRYDIFICLFYSNLRFSFSLIKLVLAVAKITAILNCPSKFVFKIIVNRQSLIYNKWFKMEYLFDQRVQERIHIRLCKWYIHVYLLCLKSDFRKIWIFLKFLVWDLQCLYVMIKKVQHISLCFSYMENKISSVEFCHFH